MPPGSPQPVTDGDDLQAQARAWIEHQPSLPRPGSGDTLVRCDPTLISELAAVALTSKGSGLVRITSPVLV